MTKARIRYAAAVGHGDFPFDMLRYDFCAPSSEAQDSYFLDYASKDREVTRVIVLKRWDGAGRWTPDRWKSFGWELVCETFAGFATEEEARKQGEYYATRISKNVIVADVRGQIRNLG